MIKTLKELKQKVNTLSPNDLLKNAAILNSLEVAKLAIKRSADVHFECDVAIRRFTYNNNFKAINYLIDNGANIHTEYNECLNYAIMNKNVEIVQYLMNLGAITEDPFFKIRLDILLNK